MPLRLGQEIQKMLSALMTDHPIQPGDRYLRLGNPTFRTMAQSYPISENRWLQWDPPKNGHHTDTKKMA